MANQRLYIVHGMGTDAVGLVGSITTPIAQAGGNIVDLRQDVLHGLFTLFMVVDLTQCSLRIDEFRKIVRDLGEDTGLTLSVDKYFPIPRNPDQKNMLLIIMGNDQPGIIASISKLLSKYEINIEFSQTIAREGFFLMELLTDIGRSVIPVENLKSELKKRMAEMQMNTFFQTEDVFNKKKRYILFDVASSFIDDEPLSEIVRQTNLNEADLSDHFSVANPHQAIGKAAEFLEGFPLEVMTSVIEGIEPTPGTMELLQTFKIMGYRVVLVSTAFTPFTQAIQVKLDIDSCHGIDLPVDDDAKTITGQIAVSAVDENRLDRIRDSVIRSEFISPEDITIVSGIGGGQPPGIRLQFDLEKILDYYNKRILSKENLLGLLGSFGLVRL